MALNRSPITVGTLNTLCSVEWENEFKNKINHILVEAADQLSLNNLETSLQNQINTVQSVPTGAVLAYAPTVIPSGWLLCAGQAVSRSLFPALFASIGTTFGAGNGTTTFNVPDLRGRVIIGLDNMTGVSANRITEVAADTLGGTGGTESVVLTIAQIPAHSHSLEYGSPSGARASSGTPNVASVAGSTGSAGGGQAHPNVQPYIALNYIIRT